MTGLFMFSLSCTPETCYEDTEAYLKASFYPDGTEVIHAPDSVTIYGLNLESDKFYNKVKQIQTVYLPLDASRDTCKYIIRINGVTDTLELIYSRYPHLVSKECGYTYYYNINADPIHTFNAIKGIYISNSNITTIDEENIHIFY